MSNTNNTVRFNLKNVHYAPMTFGSDGTPTFSTPVRMPGAVSIKLDPNGEAENFYADGGVYYVINNNMGYSGDLELALIPESFRTYALGDSLDSNGVLLERSDAELKHFALLFEFDGDIKHIRHVLYNCTASRTSMEGKTNEEKKEVQTETLSISAAPLPDGLVKGKTGNDTDSTLYNSWYTSVYTPAASVSKIKLAALSITGVSLTPAFSANEFSYAAQTGDSTNVVSATGETGATVQLLVNGSAHTSGEAATWASGINTVVAVVSKSGCANSVYTVYVTKS